MGVRYQKYRSIAIPLNIGIELSQVSRYFDIFGIEPALIPTHKYITLAIIILNFFVSCLAIFQIIENKRSHGQKYIIT